MTVPDLKKELETLQAKQKQIETDVKELEAWYVWQPIEFMLFRSNPGISGFG